MKVGKIVAGIAGAVVLCAVVVLALFKIDATANMMKKTFLPPEKYMASVVQDNLEEWVDTASGAYDKYYVNGIRLDNVNIAAKMELTLGERLSTFYSILGDYENYVNWIEKLSIDYDASLKGTDMVYNMTFGVNDADILSADVTMADGKLVMKYPELSDKTLVFSYENIPSADPQAIFANYNAILDSLPDADKINKLTKKYLKAALSEISGVEKVEGTVEVGEVSVKTTNLTLEITEELKLKSSKALLEILVEDQDLKELCRETVEKAGDFAEQMYGVTSENFDEKYEEFLEDNREELEETNEKLANYNPEDEHETYGTIEISVDGKGKIVGLSYVDDENGTFVFKAPVKADRFGLEFTYGDVTVAGSGKSTSSEIADASFDIMYEGNKLLTFEIREYDKSLLTKQSGNYEYVIKDFTSSLEMEETLNDLENATGIPASVWEKTLGESIVIKGHFDDKNGSMEMVWGEGENNLITLSVDTTITEGSDIEPLSDEGAINLENNDELMEYVLSINGEVITEGLKNANAPGEITSLVEYYFAMIEMLKYYGE